MRRGWPEHKPPLPPDPIAKKIISAAIALRDEADAICATFGPDDDVAIALGAKIDLFDAAMMSVTQWLRDATVTENEPLETPRLK